jgi:hypothetical protein
MKMAQSPRPVKAPTRHTTTSDTFQTIDQARSKLPREVLRANRLNPIILSLSKNQPPSSG